MRLPKRSLAGLLTCLTMLVVVPVLPAQTTTGQASGVSDPSHAPPTRLPAKPQVVRSYLYTNPAGPSVPNEVKEVELGKIAHIRRAAEHLKAAGKSELADRLVREALLQAKLDQIKKLQAEVDSLRKERGIDHTVTLNVKVMELHVSKMRKMGFDFQTADGVSFNENNLNFPVELAALDGLISALQKHDLVKVLAEPTLVTVSGRPASFQSGGEFPIIVPQSTGAVAVEYRQFGTRLDCLAEVLDSGRIRLELRPSVSEIDASRSVMIEDRSIPGLRTRWLDLAAEMDDGQTLVLSGPKQSRSDGDGASAGNEETALVVTVTVNLGAPVRHARKRAKPGPR